MRKRRARRLSVESSGKIHQSEKAGFGFEMPPDLDSVSIYFNQKGQAHEAERFYHYFQKCEWKTSSGTPIRNWKVAATDWIYEYMQELKLAERKLSNVI
jgi:hypothetical protein